MKMKKMILSFAFMMAIGITTSFAQEVTDASFGVRGNCGMCKGTIEKAANSVDGVSNAVWDVSKKKIDVSFDASKTNVAAIQKVIAASGYDTEKTEASETAYKNLHGCCQYDPKQEMNQSDKAKKEDHSGHKH